jgi:hypothetical protein
LGVALAGADAAAGSVAAAVVVAGAATPDVAIVAAGSAATGLGVSGDEDATVIRGTATACVW